MGDHHRWIQKQGTVESVRTRGIGPRVIWKTTQSSTPFKMQLGGQRLQRRHHCPCAPCSRIIHPRSPTYLRFTSHKNLVDHFFLFPPQSTIGSSNTSSASVLLARNEEARKQYIATSNERRTKVNTKGQAHYIGPDHSLHEWDYDIFATNMNSSFLKIPTSDHRAGKTLELN